MPNVLLTFPFRHLAHECLAGVLDVPVGEYDKERDGEGSSQFPEVHDRVFERVKVGKVHTKV